MAVKCETCARNAELWCANYVHFVSFSIAYHIHYGGGGGGGTSFQVILTRGLKVLAMLKMKRGRKRFLPFTRGGGGRKVLLCLKGGGGGGSKQFWTPGFPIL